MSLVIEQRSMRNPRAVLHWYDFLCTRRKDATNCAAYHHICNRGGMSVKNVQFSVAAHILAVLGFHYGEEVSSKILADSVNADPTFVRKSLSKLSKAGLVVTTRGKTGAATLARAPGKITLLDIYRASGVPPGFGIHSYSVEPRCSVSCGLKPCLSKSLSQAQNSFEKSLAKTTLADLLSEIQHNKR